MSGEREHYPDDRPRAPTIRSRLMLEVASELVGRADFAPKQAQISLRQQGAGSWEMSLFGSDALSAAHEVAAGRVDFAIVNPATVVHKAIQGRDPFPAPVPLRAIATIPSHDQLGVAITRKAGIGSFTQLTSERPALRVSLRGSRPDHSVHTVVDDVLAASGTSLDQLREWGGQITYHDGIPHRGARRAAIEGGEVDLIIDEGIYNWVDLAIGLGFRFLSLSDEALESLETAGYRRSTIAARDYEQLAEGVTTLDFSGFLVYTHERVPDQVVAAFCSAIDARQERIPWQGGPSLPLARMVTDAEDAPVPLPFHPAAESYWRSAGYLT